MSAIAAMGPIVQNPMHPSHAAAVARIGALARTLPDGAAAERWFGGVAQDTALRSSAGLLFGKHRYAQGAYEEAIAALRSIDDRDPTKPAALLLAAGAHVRLGRSVPAVQCLLAAQPLLDVAPPSYERTYLKNLVLLSIARIHQTAAARIDENDAPTIDSSKISAAVKYYEQVDTGSQLWPDAALGMATIFLNAGNQPLAMPLANLLSSPALPSSHAAEAAGIKAQIQFSTCNYDDAAKTAQASRTRAAAIRGHLGAVIAAADATGRDDAWLDVLFSARDGRPGLDPSAATEIARTLADRTTARRLALLDRIDAEAQTLARSGALASSPAPALLARERARVVGLLASGTREHVVATKAALDAAIEDADKLLVAVTAAMRNQLDAALAGGLTSLQESESLVPRPQQIEIDPFAPRLPASRPRYATRLFHQWVASKCGR